MSYEERRKNYLSTSEITALLQHRTTAVTRAWISDRKLKAIEIDRDTRENLYERDAIESAIAEASRRGPYRVRDEEPPRHGQLPASGQ